jgi:hypothetical protein
LEGRTSGGWSIECPEGAPIEWLGKWLDWWLGWWLGWWSD